MVADVEGLVVVAGVLVVDEADVTWGSKSQDAEHMELDLPGMADQSPEELFIFVLFKYSYFGIIQSQNLVKPCLLCE